MAANVVSVKLVSLEAPSHASSGSITGEKCIDPTLFNLQNLSIADLTASVNACARAMTIDQDKQGGSSAGSGMGRFLAASVLHSAKQELL